MVALLVLQVFGIVAAAVASGIEIESIVFSGPATSTLGLLLAALAYRADRPLGLFFGLAAPTLSVLCFCLIFGLRWSPADARVPIFVIVTIAMLASVALGCLAVREVYIRRRFPRARVPFQFSIKSLLVFTLACAVLARIVSIESVGHVALAIAASYTAALVMILRRFKAGQKLADDEPRSTPLGDELTMIEATPNRHTHGAV